MNESKSPEVTFKYYLPDNEDDLWLTTNAYEMYALLMDIVATCRSVIKYDDKASDDKREFAEKISDLIHSSVDLDKVK